MANDKFWQDFESNLILIVGLGWLTGIQKAFMPECFIYLSFNVVTKWP